MARARRLRDPPRGLAAAVHGYRPNDDLGTLAAKVIAIAAKLLAADVAALAS